MESLEGAAVEISEPLIAEESVVYTASFTEGEDDFINYQTALWISYSLLLILAWGLGFLMLLYLPLRRFILRKDIRSRTLYITPHSIVYKVSRPVALPCFGVLKRDKHVLLSSVADIVIEQGYLQSRFGVYSIRVENAGVRRPPSDDVQIQGIVNPHAFRKAVLMNLSNMRSEVLNLEASVTEDVPSARIGHSTVPSMSPSRSFKCAPASQIGEQMILQKLEEVGNSVMRLHTLIGAQQPQTPEENFRGR
ncbi:hypothetical protein LIER_40716 [Lithospermum erythrorhizon]|uniref:DUF7642 domain-containing protein n=1 Tax=Lithospermum erythrorhizon TaxID=34254 RepID=A0AAV3R0W1_LITER